MATVTVRARPWHSQADRGLFDIYDRNGVRAGTLSGIAWRRASHGRYGVHEYDDQSFMVLGRLQRTFKTEAEMLAWITADCNAPTPPSAGFTQQMAETYSDNRY
jgi:hypothetical protein